jgi:CRP-like cAMP-binding protein
VHELAAAQEQFVLLGRKTATERIASFILRLSERSNANTAGIWLLIGLTTTQTQRNATPTSPRR